MGGARFQTAREVAEHLQVHVSAFTEGLIWFSKVLDETNCPTVGEPFALRSPLAEDLFL
ncbi:hypothetical protein SERLA73DRAFT_137425, partial [Serpula lacrymans var. lacrymans S7.3]